MIFHDFSDHIMWFSDISPWKKCDEKQCETSPYFSPSKKWWFSPQKHDLSSSSVLHGSRVEVFNKAMSSTMSAVSYLQSKATVGSRRWRWSGCGVPGYGAGWWFGCHFWHFPINIGNFSSSQLTKSYFQRGGPTTNQGVIAWLHYGVVCLEILWRFMELIHPKKPWGVAIPTDQGGREKGR